MAGPGRVAHGTRGNARNAGLRSDMSVRPLLNSLILDIRTAILEWNEVPAERPTIDPAILDEMRVMYRDDVALLSRLVQRDLSHWLQAPPESATSAAPQRGKELALQG